MKPCATTDLIPFPGHRSMAEVRYCEMLIAELGKIDHMPFSAQCSLLAEIAERLGPVPSCLVNYGRPAKPPPDDAA